MYVPPPSVWCPEAGPSQNVHTLCCICNHHHHGLLLAKTTACARVLGEEGVVHPLLCSLRRRRVVSWDVVVMVW